MLIRQSDASLLTITLQPAAMDVKLPNGSVITSLHAGTFSLPNLPTPVPAYIFSDQSLDTSLLSISELCNLGCVATFSATGCVITHHDTVVLECSKPSAAKLWHFSLPSLPFAPSVNATRLLSSDRSFVLFAHAAFGSPALSTFLRAVRLGYLCHWPRLTSHLLQTFLPHTIATAQGHLNQRRQGLDSTRSPPTPPSLPFDSAVDVPDSLAEANSAYVHMLRLPLSASADLTGKFPVTSSSGSQYVLITVMDGYIHVEPMCTRTHTEYVRCFKRMVSFFASHNRKPIYLRLDNESSAAVETYMRQERISIQYCPPGQHRANVAERCIQTFKNHAIATLATTDPSFPLTLWDRLLPQMELCLNHLLPYHPNTSISAYAGLHGAPHDFRAHPIAPAGIKVLVHDKPQARASWAPHGVPGFYLGPAPQHYRCFEVYIPSTSSTRVTDTVEWFPHGLHMPDPTPHDCATAALSDLAAALRTLTSHPPSAHSTPQLDRSTTIVTQLHDLLHMYSPSYPPSPPPAVPPPLPSSPVLPPPPLLLTAAHTRQYQRVPLPPTPLSPASSDCPAALPSPAYAAPGLVPIPPPLTFLPVSLPILNPPSPALPHGFPVAPLDAPPPFIPLNLASDGSPLTYRSAKAGPDAAHWLRAEIEEFTRLFASQTMRPIHPVDQPLDRRRDTTYYNPQTKQKRDALGNVTYRIRGTAGGDKIHYDGPTSALTADMPVVKLLLHSVVSEGASWMTVDIKDYYLGTPLLRPEYVRIPFRFLPPAVITAHNLQPYVNNDTVLFEITKGMYGLPQAGLLAQQRLITHLALHGYLQTPTPCLFKHATNGTVFTLVVDDFGIKYTTAAGANHLISTLKLLYEIKVDWTGQSYIGFTIRFDPATKSVALSMPGYIAKVLRRFNVSSSPTAASPAVYTPPHYGQPLQTPTTDTTALLDPPAVKLLQEQVGCLLYYARSVDSTILPAVTHISSRQASPTLAVAAAMTRLLRYCARYPDNQLVFHAGSMQLSIHSDASYLSRPHSRSVAGAVFYLSSPPLSAARNGPCLALSSIIPVVVSSVAEAEYAALFYAAREGVMLRNILHSLGYPQSSTLLYCDNACAVGIANDTITPRRTKSIDMQFHWIRDRVRQHQFTVTWLKGADNLADFFTKALPVHTHTALMSAFVNTPPSSSASHAHTIRRRRYLQQFLL